MAEYKRQVGVAVTTGIVLAAFVGVLAITNAPVNVTTTSSQSLSTTTNPTSSASSSSGSTSNTATTTNGTSQLYRVEFIQESNCPYGVWLVPWAVVMNNQTVVQPSNATLPLTYAATRLSYNSTYSTIWFSVPNGTYGYSILPNNFYGQEQHGNVTVDGSNVQVQVTAFITAMGCTSTTTVVGTTVTVTETITTVASNATTTYVPPSGCDYLPITITTTATVTVGPTPPTSTTTTTVTATSTSYTQTTTVTSCTYSESTVTSTVTTTTNP